MQASNATSSFFILTSAKDDYISKDQLCATSGILARMAHTWKRFVAPDSPDRGLPVLRGHAARARLANRTRMVPGVGELYSVRRRLKKISTPLSFPHAGKPVGARNGQG